VSWNSEAFLKECLESVIKASDGNLAEILVLDNASKIPPQQLFGEEFPRVKWFENPTNLGFGKACNLLAKYSIGEYLFFVNPDTFVSKESFSQLMGRANQINNLGLFGPKIFNGDGSLQGACRRSFPKVGSSISSLLGLDRIFPESKLLGQYNLTFLKEEKEMAIDALSGSFFGVKRDVYQAVEGFDEEFFLYGEDLDLCYRVQKSGYVNMYFPQAEVLHFKGHGKEFRPLRVQYHFWRAMMIYSKRHYSKSVISETIINLGIVVFFLAKLVLSLRVFKPFASLMRFSWIVFLVLFVFPPNYWLWGALALGFLQEVLVVLNEKRFKTRPVLIEDQNGKNYLEDMYEGVGNCNSLERLANVLRVLDLRGELIIERKNTQKLSENDENQSLDGFFKPFCVVNRIIYDNNSRL
jgi:GT2 family glycosyltransferase